MIRFFSIAATVVALSAGVAGAADFKVESSVLFSNAAGGGTHSTAIFAGDVVYDFLESPREATILEAAAGRMTSVDFERKLVCVQSLEEVKTFAERLRAEARQHDQAMIVFMADPKFTERFDPNSNRLTMASTFLSYSVDLEPAEASVWGRYREFSDWHARYNVMMNPGALPPFARMVVNEAIARRESVPGQVELKLYSAASTAQPLVLRAVHTYGWRLDADDRRRVADVEQARKAFRAVTRAEYMLRNETATRPAAGGPVRR